MLQKLLQIAGVSTKEEFYKKYPTEDAFLKAHPEARQLLSKKTQQSPMMVPPPQAMYGGMAYGGHFLPRAKYGMQPQGEPEPINSDYPDYGSFKAAHDNWLANQQEQANNPQIPEEMQTATSVNTSGQPVSVNPNASQVAPAAAPAPSTKLNDYQGSSVFDFLTTQGKAGDYKSRKKLAASLGMSGYRGTASQNEEMMNMIRQNPDILNSYDDATAPQGNVTRAAAQTANKKAAPSTSELANTKHEYQTLPGVTVYSKARKYTNMPGVTVYSGSKTRVPYANKTHDQIDYTGVDPESIEASGMPGYIRVGEGNSIFNRIPLNQNQNPYMRNKPKYVGMKPEQHGIYDKAWSTFQKELEGGDKHPYIPRSISDYYDTREWKAALEDFKQQNNIQKMGGEPCYNCGGMYEHGGYYGNVPQHSNPGTYADGTSGTFNGGQGFALGGFFQDASDAMRTGSLQGLAGSLLPIANMASNKLFGDKSAITSDITKLDANGQPIKNSNLKDELSKYLSNATGDIKKEDLQAIVSKFDMGGMAAQGYIPEYGSQSYGGFAYGGAPLPQYNMGSSYQDGGSPLYSTQGKVLRNYTNTLAYTPGGWSPSHVTLPQVGFDSVMPSYGFFPDGGEVSPEDQEAMAMQQAQQDQGQQQAPPQEGGAPEQGQGQVDPQQIIQAVGQMLQQGMQPEEIAQKLVQMGIPQDQAMQVIQAVMQQMQGGQGQGMQEEMAEGPQGQEAPQQEAMEGQAPPMGRWGGKFGYGGFNTTMDTTQPPYGVSNLSKFTGQTMMEPSLEAMHEAAMRRSNVSRAGGYNDQVAQQYAQAASEAAALNANHRMERQMELEQMKRNQPYFNMNPSNGNINKYPSYDTNKMPVAARPYADGGSIGEEMDVTPEQMEYLRKQGYKFDII
jgi:hypothetical protein